MSREYPQYPILAVSAVIFNSSQSVLLIKRANPPARNRWALPGGAVQLGETPEGALQRETREECGVEIEIGKVNQIASRVFHDASGKIQYHYIIINYTACILSGEIRSGSDALDSIWAPFSELPRMDLAEGVYEVIQKAVQKEGR